MEKKIVSFTMKRYTYLLSIFLLFISLFIFAEKKTGSTGNVTNEEEFFVVKKKRKRCRRKDKEKALEVLADQVMYCAEGIEILVRKQKEAIEKFTCAINGNDPFEKMSKQEVKNFTSQQVVFNDRIISLENSF